MKSLNVAGRGLVALAVLSLLASQASAHFPWLTVDDQGHALLYFGESPAERDYHMPEAVAKATVEQVGADGSVGAIELPAKETDDFIGRASADALEAGSGLRTQFTYGIYRGTLLKYYARYQPLAKVDQQPNPHAEKGAAAMPLDAQLTATAKGIDVRVTLAGKPLEGASVTLIDGAGEQATDKTNDKGLASFTSLAEGLVGFIVGHTVKEAGEVDGKKYETESHYLTLTTSYAKAAAQPQADLPPLPMPVSSFGAAVCDGYVYAYSGHTGKAHDHSRDNLSPYFCRYQLAGGDDWEQLPLHGKLQGLALVAYNGKVYRIGGLEARNDLADDADLHSVATFGEYDPAAKQWTDLAPLPSPRSSHNAVVIGDRLYVVGGWTLAGDDAGEWQPSALVYNFTQPESGWQALPEPPFLRRALAVASLDGKLVVMGGMDDAGDVCQETFVFDPQSKAWTSGPAIPGEAFHSFGLSSCEADGQLYASGMAGKVYALSPGGSEWREVGKIAAPRFFHQLLPADGALLVIAGATHDQGHVGTTEVIVPSAE